MIIGITGGIASGKSTASNYLEDQGYPVVDADKIAKEIVEPNKPTLTQIAEHFGQGMLHEDGSLNREKLGSIVFQNEEARLTLNSIMHPAIRREMLFQADEYLKEGNQIVFLDIPLLFESKLTSIVDQTLLIYVPKEIQLERLMRRNGYSQEEALSRIASQMPINEKKKLANVTIDNSGSKEDLSIQLDKYLSNLRY
ncbi:dephospho-CoA kinase [Mangrovibacillus cuniculi]|uniref:Dephospho-CoA kinase n=1 Tax=Mangrovibacillus cuniculi TaxID=2593652 RepID=A0A7S8CC09_9BACI|nr:dephospho-CoA kinase [Mangrovibacillus cuniculi]QPC47193.1 dephospho-CoA kinase [Mangrovibacillus cuniculi]